MILFDLRCSKGHGFEAWFRDSKSYDRLAEAGEIRCAVCGDGTVEKALMAPAVRTRKAEAPPILEPAAAGPETGQTALIPTGGKTAMTSAPQSSSLPERAIPEKVVEAMKMLRQVQTFVEKNFDHVGKGFAEEARKIHYGEAEKRNIYGETSREEAETLAEEGIEVNQMPWLPSRDS